MYIEIDDDVYNAFDDELKSKLKPYEPEDTTGLKNKANELLSEKKALELQVAESQAEIKKLKVAPPKGADAEKLQSQLDDAMNKLKQSQESYQALEQNIKKEKVNTIALEIANELSTNTKRAKLLAEKIADRIAIDDGSPVVLDANGNPTVSSTDDLKAQMKTDYDFLCDGSLASGGGSKGGSGGAANTLKKFNEYSGQELKDLRTSEPEQYERIKNEFYASSGV